MDRRSFVLVARQDWPVSRDSESGHPLRPPIPASRSRCFVRLPQGGAGDILTRAAADHVRTKRNVAVGVEYRPGAGATIAPAQIAKAASDGATLGLYSISPFLTVPHLQKVPYDTLKDFTYISIYAYIRSRFMCWPIVRSTTGTTSSNSPGTIPENSGGDVGRARRGAYRD
jgi:hypothetical protein